MSDSKNDRFWKEIFEKYHVLERISRDSCFEISAKTINKFREARLMTKFDHRSQLPKIFSKNKLSVLPISRGSYIIGKFETFFNFNLNDLDVSTIKFPTFLESLNYRDITSEATAINCAFVTKILHDFTNEENLFPTVSGRMRSSTFSYKIKSASTLFKVDVENSQIEIDGGYEGDNSLNLIEAKNYISADFLVRQLYYPFRLWSDKISKKIRPIFLTYSNGIFHLREYEFTDPYKYNSLILVQEKKYVIQEGSFDVGVLQELVKTAKVEKEPTDVPFPQANSFERVINLCELIKQNHVMTKEQYLQDFDFVLAP